MQNEAINFTFGDLIFVEVALVSYMKELDLSMQSGQYLSELLGKVEYNLSQIRTNANLSMPNDFKEPEPIPEPGK